MTRWLTINTHTLVSGEEYLMEYFLALFFIARKVSVKNADDELYRKVSANALAMSLRLVTFMSLTDRWLMVTLDSFPLLLWILFQTDFDEFNDSTQKHNFSKMTSYPA